MKVRKVVATLLTVSALGMGANLSWAQPASAAGAVSVYVSLPTWLGNCPGGGSVKYLQVSTFSPAVGDYRSDGGDDLVYIQAAKDTDTTVVARGLCYNGTKTYWGANVSQTIRANRNGQTWWVGPNGVRRN